ncbi:ubiquitin specific porotease 4 family protein protein [Babesia ovis]|uniref:ubiquitinyl hydrolase 1 n=1 Tax=Babesia ovis TaxID=5869 RepID=A0A9W5WVI5_BABOV|nr:ubiquitin specific porotease 4 family protein protein [Babesia ovis]
MSRDSYRGSFRTHCTECARSNSVRLPNYGPLRISGLENDFNNCYCNAVLQALYPLSSFRERMIYMKNSTSEISSALGKLYELCDSPRGTDMQCWPPFCSGVQSPADLLQRICNKNAAFVMGEQQDAHEFLTCLINSINEEIQAIERRWEEARFSFISRRHALHAIEDGYTFVLPPRRTWLSKLLEGTLLLETTCHMCEQVSSVVEPFLTLSVEIFEACNVERCLQRYSDWELLTGPNQYFCRMCNGHRDASRRSLFNTLPPVFMIHLKRFKFNPLVCLNTNNTYGYCYNRLPHYVVSNRNITLTDLHHADPMTYELFAIICHIGSSPHFGHYVAFTHVEGHWYRCDDENATAICNISAELGDENTYGNPFSYILFYKLKSLTNI